MGWDDPVGPEGFVLHKHWCDICEAYWQHDEVDCEKPRNWPGDHPDWPCPEHEGEKRCD